jgi:hypothetical protein
MDRCTSSYKHDGPPTRIAKPLACEVGGGQPTGLRIGSMTRQGGESAGHYIFLMFAAGGVRARPYGLP